MNSINLNGKLIAAGTPVLQADNRAFRYGDGLFETMKLYKGTLLLKEYHFNRLFESLAVLGIPAPSLFTRDRVEQEITALCRKNKCDEFARVRLTVWRGHGGLYEENTGLEYMIECWPLSPTFKKLNENGLVIGVFPEARKSCDAYAAIKSASFLPYAMAARFAKEQQWNDAIVLNQYDRVADSTIANLFMIKNGVIITPPLKEGCINGVMRKYVLDSLSKYYIIKQDVIGLSELKGADEVFLTNAIKGLTWVAEFEGKTYTKKTIETLYSKTVEPFFT